MLLRSLTVMVLMALASPAQALTAKEALDIVVGETDVRIEALGRAVVTATLACVRELRSAARDDQGEQGRAEDDRRDSHRL